MKTCTKIGRVRGHEGEEEKEGWKAGRCMDNVIFICLAELKLQVCLRLLWIKKKWVMLSSIAYQLNKSPIFFFPSSLQNFIEWYPDSKEQLQTRFSNKHFFNMSATIFFIISICKYNSVFCSEHNENLSNLKSS